MFVCSIVSKKRDKDILIMEQELKIMGFWVLGQVWRNWLKRQVQQGFSSLFFAKNKINLGYTQTQTKPSLRLNFRSVRKTG